MNSEVAITGRLGRRFQTDGCFISRFMFYLAFGVWLMACILVYQSSGTASFRGIPGYVTVFDAVRYACLIIIAVREIVFGFWDRASVIGLVVFACLGAISLNANCGYIAESCVFVLAARNMRFRSVALFSICVMTACIAIIALSSLTGFNADVIWDKETRPRHNLGFSHPNTGPALLFFVLCLWAYVRGERYGIIDAAAMLLLAICAFIPTKSRTFLVFAIALVLVASFVRLASKHSKSMDLSRILCAVPIPLLAAIQLTCASSYNGSVPWMAWANTLLSSRLKYWSQAISQYGMSAFGSSQSVSFPLDGVYVCVFSRLGIVFFVVSLAVVCVGIIQLHDKRERLLIAIIFLIALYGFTETCVIMLWFNPFLLVLGQVFGKDRATLLPSRLTENLRRGRHEA